MEWKCFLTLTFANKYHALYMKNGPSRETNLLYNTIQYPSCALNINKCCEPITNKHP